MNERALAIEVRELSKDFGSFHAVDRVSFNVYEGQVFGFLGPNGAGKSTTIRMLTGLLLPTSGLGRVAGYDVVKDHLKIKQHIGYMSQRFSLYDDLTVNENLQFFGGVYGLSPARIRQRSQEVLGVVGLADRAGEVTRNLAGGLRQRLALASAVLHQPSILFLDEPTSGVDPISRRTFWDLIGDLSRQGVTILVTTHYLDEAEFCDRLILIYQGRIVAQGTPRELRQSLPGRILAIQPSQLGHALDIARSLPRVLEANIFGDSLHVMAEEDEEIAEPLGQALAAQGISMGQAHYVEPTLEDAFISFIQEAGR